MLGHTAAWKVTTLTSTSYAALKRFVGSHAKLDGSIARHRIEMAVRAASKQTGRALRIVRRDVVDASGVGRAAVLPVVARLGRGYVLSQNLFSGRHADTFEALEAAYVAERLSVHSTVVAEIVKRYVREALMGFSLRDHGGVYFVPKGREKRLFDLEAFLRVQAIGSITRIRVMGDVEETEMLTSEIQRLVKAKLDELSARLALADLKDPEVAEKVRGRFGALRSELAEMQSLFGFAGEEIARHDAKARRLLAKAVREAGGHRAKGLSLTGNPGAGAVPRGGGGQRGGPTTFSGGLFG